MTRCNLIQDMVHIKKVEIFGFKSFGFRNTVVDFRPGLVSISGPNGSGKSNILDAIIFASGEMRPKVMRVDKIRSLIHDVSSSGGGSRMARDECSSLQEILLFHPLLILSLDVLHQDSLRRILFIGHLL